MDVTWGCFPVLYTRKQEMLKLRSLAKLKHQSSLQQEGAGTGQNTALIKRNVALEHLTGLYVGSWVVLDRVSKGCSKFRPDISACPVCKVGPATKNSRPQANSEVRQPTTGIRRSFGEGKDAVELTVDGISVQTW